MSAPFSAANAIFVFAVTVLTFVPERNREAFFTFLDTTEKLFIAALILVLVFVVWVLAWYGFGKLLLSKGENKQHNVQVIALPNSDQKIEGQIVRYFASLKLINKEKVKITNCYAVIRKATPVTSDKDITDVILGNAPKRLSWSDNQNNPNFEITIGAEKGEAILHVYQSAINLFADSVVTSDFCTSDPVTRLSLDGQIVIYKIEIDFLATSEQTS